MALPTSGLVLHNRVADAGTCFKTIGNPPSGAAADGDVVLEWAKEADASVDYAFNPNNGTDGYVTFDADGMGAAALYMNGRASGPEDRQGLVTRNLANSANVGGTSFYAVLAPFTWAVAFRVNAFPASGRGCIFGTLSGGQTALYASTDGKLKLWWWWFNNAVTDIDLGAIETGKNYVAIVRYKSSGGDQAQVYLDTVDTPVFNGAVIAAQDHGGRPFGIGGDISSNANYFDGWVGEIAAYNSYLAGADLSDLMNYLVAAWPNSAPGGGGGASAAPKFEIASAPNRGTINGRRPCWA
jgi:hypothetical protein